MNLLNRPRRLRRTAGLRRMVRETTLSAADMIAPLFIAEGQNIVRPISSMPGHAQRSVDQLGGEIDELMELRIPAVLLFGIPAQKDANGSGAWDANGPVPSAIRAIKERAPDMLVVADVCMCEYTDHGHCGVLSPEPGSGDVLNDPTLDLLARAAVAYADAGADIIAPSAMMDGQVAAIRDVLDSSGHDAVGIMAYAAKFASAFYGPFREAAECAPRFGDRSGYQMDPANAEEAIREVRADIDEGADVVMIKPALPYLDVIRKVKDATSFPVAAYNVSGEYAMVKAAAQNGWLDERRTVLEILTSIRRAGADLILTYHAGDAAEWLRQG